MNKDLIIQKQKELLKLYKDYHFDPQRLLYTECVTKCSKLELELAALKSEQEKPEQSSQEELREELIKFANTLVTLPVTVWEIDEYLKSK